MITSPKKSVTLTIAGIGPGAHEHITPAVLHAIEQADVVVGYTTYIKLVKTLLINKTIIRTGMTEEISRAQAAVDEALRGKNVVVISSGDGGVYGMLSLIFDILQQCGWKKGNTPTLKILPGITALNACASLVGAPLGHDFCAISLSDLLTPWSVIIKRVEAAAHGDFVIGLYNPASGRRTRQIVAACEMIERYRSPDTPVALVKSAYRRREKIVITSLKHCLEYEIGMLTTVLIGSSQTKIYDDYMITPRGYKNKYTSSGEALPGQTPGRSLKTTEGYDKTYDNNKYSTINNISINHNKKHKEEKKENHLHDKQLYLLYRLGGAMILLHHAEHGQEAYMIGDKKEPCDFRIYGMDNPSERDAKKMTFIQLKLLDKKISPKVLYPAIRFHTLLTNKACASLLSRRFLIERNGMVSERLWTFVLSSYPEEQEVVDCRWIIETPYSVWDVMRSTMLKCL